MSDSQRKVAPRKLLLISKHPCGNENDKNDEMLPEENPKLKGQKNCVLRKKLQDYLHVSCCT